MKIALVSPYDFTWPGGVTIHVSQLARELSRSGHEVQVLAPHSPSRECEDSDLLVPLGRSVPLPSGGSIARVSLSWWLARRIRALLNRERYDIIHLHEPMAPILPLTVLEYSNTVNVGTFHACHNRQHLYRMSQPLIKRWHQRLHGNIAVSTAARRYVNSTFPGTTRSSPTASTSITFPRMRSLGPSTSMVRPTSSSWGGWRSGRACATCWKPTAG